MTDSWEEISPSSDAGGVNLRRADVTHPFDFFRGRDHEGRYIFALQGHFSGREVRELPRLSGLSISINRDNAGLSTLLITLIDRSQVEVFRALCSNLMSAAQISLSGDDEAAVDSVIGRLIRWQELLKARREKLLSRQEQIGLFGEILVLRDLFLSNLKPLEAVCCWRGPEADEQDFLFRNWMIEVKSQLSSSDSRLQISSEHQLDPESGSIALCHQKLGVSDAAGSCAETLNSLISDLAERLSDSPAAVDRFNSILIEFGYEEKPEYSASSWTLNSRDFFQVQTEFPRVVPSMLPFGIGRVRYEITLDSIRPFMVTENQVLGWIFGSDKSIAR